MANIGVLRMSRRSQSLSVETIERITLDVSQEAELRTQHFTLACVGRISPRGDGMKRRTTLSISILANNGIKQVPKSATTNPNNNYNNYNNYEVKSGSR